MFDSKPAVKEKSKAIIDSSRKSQVSERKFRIPLLNFAANCYTKVIDCEAVGHITEPLFTRHFLQ